MKKFLKEILPPFIWNILIECYKGLSLALKKGFELAGYNVALKKDYYSPLPVVSELKTNLKRWYKPSKLEGLEYNIEELKSYFSRMLLKYYDEYSQYSDYSVNEQRGFGPGFTSIDALTLYLIIRDRKPKVYIEIGSGLSTYYASIAAKKNNEEGHPLFIKSIEPYPYEKLYDISSIEVNNTEVQNVDISLFQELEENDILFIDSSHVVKIDGDVPYLYLEVLPTLKKGVLIHIHDIPFPFNIPYPPELWIFKETWPAFWNEAMFLQAFLCFNHKFKIFMSTPLIRYIDESFLKRNIPIYETIDENPNTFSSMWIQKVA